MFVFVASCKDDKLLGLEVQPEGEFDRIKLVDTIEVLANSAYGERQRSDEAQSFIGRIRNDVFGQSSSALMFNLRMASSVEADPGLSDYTIDSVVLYLRPYNIYGNYTEAIPIEVYQLREKIYLDSIYYSDYTPQIDDQLLGTEELKFTKSDFSDKDTIRVSGVKQQYLYTVRLDNDFGSNLVAGLGKDYTNTETLQDYFKGFYIKVADVFQPESYGAVYQFALTSGESGLKVYMSKPGNESQILNLGINASNARVNLFSHNYTSSVIEDYISDNTNSDEEIFIQGMAGTSANIEIPGLNHFGRDKSYAISKAELTLKISEEMSAYYVPASRLYLLTFNDSGEERFTLDFVNSPSRNGGLLNSTESSYTFDISRHIQSVLDASKQGDDINFGFSIRSQVPAINGNEPSQTALAGKDIELKIYYTDLTD